MHGTFTVVNCTFVLFLSPQVSPQRVADPYTPMHATLTASSSVGRLCDYEAMARNSTSSDSESEDDDRYINCTTPRNGSSKWSIARNLLRRVSTLHSNANTTLYNMLKIVFSNCPNLWSFAAVSCANLHLFPVTLCNFVQETAASNPKFGQILNKILTCYSRQCCGLHAQSVFLN